MDEGDRFAKISGRYFSHFNDRKFRTAQCCVRNTGRILSHKEDLVDQVVRLLINLDNTCDYPQKQKELLKSDVVTVLRAVYLKARDRDAIDRFIKDRLKSTSPKTRKMATEFIKQHQLSSNKLIENN